MITINLYIKACANCGKDKVKVAKLQRYAYGTEGVTLRIKDSRYNDENRRKHLFALSLIGLTVDSYPSMVEIVSDVPLPDGTFAIYKTLEQYVKEIS